MGGDLNARILQPLARFLAERHGTAAIEKAARVAGMQPEQLDGRSHWISLEHFDGLLQVARTYVADDEAFKAACAYRLADGYGALRYVLWAASPHLVYQRAMSGFRMVCTYGANEVVSVERTRLHVRFRSTKPEGRLVCLSRQAQIAALPTLWGLPPAMLREEACIARGDEYCGYYLRWFDRKRWLPGALGFALGAGGVAVLSALGFREQIGAVSLPALGAALGYLYEMRRTAGANLGVREEINDALRKLAQEETEARQEILQLHQRQRDWTRLLENDAADREAVVRRVVDQLQRLQQIRETKILGFSHDLRNPLTVMTAGASFLRKYAPGLGEEGELVIDDIEGAVERMRALLEELMVMASQRSPMSGLAPQRIETELLTERLRRRLRALVQGKDIRASVFRTREAPESIETDPLLFDRVMDNLLGNAVKYTDRGSIVLEVDGTPQSLVLKLSDTGRGIQGDDLERAFMPNGSERVERAKNSYGVGLSVVVELLAQVGGRIEVMSKPSAGTTFWVHFPLVPVRQFRSDPGRTTEENVDDLRQRVVTIRKVKSA
ncbi:MAG: hypothetical protein NVSMB47_02710 [Polyangiales bacterium]